jgi:poly-gamma-glutamate synthase PgsB/CapB
MTEQETRKLLSLGIHPAWRLAEEKLLIPLAQKFVAEEEGRIRSRRADKVAVDSLALRLIRFVQREIQLEGEALSRLRNRHAEFTQRYARSVSEDERRFHTLAYAKAMGRSNRELAEDRRAFGRWFGMDAVTDRYLRRHTLHERVLSFCLNRLGALSVHLIGQAGEPGAQAALWQKLELERATLPLLAHDGDNRVVVEAFRCLAASLKALPQAMQGTAVAEGTLQFIYRSALESRQQVWVQCEALNLLQSLSLPFLRLALHKRLTEPLDGDDLFLRRHAVRLLGETLPRSPDLVGLIPAVLADPSPFVRQALPAALSRMSMGDDAKVLRWFEQSSTEDASPQVRAAALLALPGLLARGGLFDSLLGQMQALLRQEQDAFVLRVAFQVSVEVSVALASSRPEQQALWLQSMRVELSDLHCNASSIAVRRWAAQAGERLWCQSDPAARQLLARLGEWLQDQKPGRYGRVPEKLLSGADPEVTGRVLAILAQDDFGLDLAQGRWRSRLMRGHRFGMRLWRVLHEFRNPSPDKRQAFRHTVGRVFSGNLRAPSSILAELAETKVPGEPLFLSGESGWRPYLPLLDDVISTLDAPGGKVRLYSSEGVTQIAAPRNVFVRVKSRWLLATRFAQLARLRNWQENSQAAPSAYVHALRKLGFEVSFLPHGKQQAEEQPDPAVTRFFSSGLAVPLGENWQRMEEYFFSVYQNSLNDLAVFTALVLAYFVGKHLYANWRIRQTRENLPLVLGGWGTRGKSGTERIKAAMLNALGYSLVSKTTGCEAMFLYADPYGKMREMFLFRPYDKATIWEQFDVMRHAEGLGADIFLWECMALTPSYVRILQRHWVRDDISTITNTFPDHEDLQGPAGLNIPEVMTNFIPRRSILITSEEQMLPILREAARENETRLEQVGWLEAGMLTPDVLQRFPYDEHPYNIALVMRMGQELGIAPDFALKEMADRVVPDLGVLKTYPEALVKGRRLVFVNGMSANERFGCLGNWTRMGFDRQDPDAEPGVWISTVVNNRADRVARSRVFAGILVNDISADRHFLIGSNLPGLMGYIEEAWSRFAQQLTLWPESDTLKDARAGDASSPQAVLQDFAGRYRVAVSEEAVRRRAAAMLQGMGLGETEALLDLWRQPQALSESLAASGFQEYAADIAAAVQRMNEELGEYQAFFEQITHIRPSDQKRLDLALHQLLHTWFKRRIVVVHDFYASGDAIVDMIRSQTPPGILNRVMGIQNIKGTGLDFVYRWQAWDTCYRACDKLRSGKPGVMEQGLRELAAFQEFGLLCAEHVRDTLTRARQSAAMQRESFQAELKVIESNLELALEAVRGKMNIVRQSGWMLKLLEGLEALLDAGDAVKRRKTADQIYRDLINERISVERAVLELQALNKRQKGGWLLGQLHHVKGYLYQRGATERQRGI